MARKPVLLFARITVPVPDVPERAYMSHSRSSSSGVLDELKPSGSPVVMTVPCQLRHNPLQDWISIL